MCSYDTTTIDLRGSAKRESGWTGIGGANLYYACPYHSALDHALSIDFTVKDHPRQRIAIELSAASAKALAHAILDVLAHEAHEPVAPRP